MKMSEQERLILVQELIDRLLYLEGKGRREFLSHLGRLYVQHPVPRKIRYDVSVDEHIPLPNHKILNDVDKDNKE